MFLFDFGQEFLLFVMCTSVCERVKELALQYYYCLVRAYLHDLISQWWALLFKTDKVALNNFVMDM